MLELDELLKIFNEGSELEMDEDAAEACNYYSQEAQKITCEIINTIILMKLDNCFPN